MYVPSPHATHAADSDAPSVRFPYLPASHSVHALALGAVEYVPAAHPWHVNSAAPPLRTTRYPARHTHCASVAPAGESEYGGHPVHDPDWPALYVFGEQSVQALAPPGAYLPAPHHAHARYDCAPSWLDDVPLGHSWHVASLGAPVASENVPVLHSRHAVARVALDHCPFPHAVHSDAFPSENVPSAHTPHVDAPAPENSPGPHHWRSVARSAGE